MNIRRLRNDEIDEARKVFHNSIVYQDVYIAAYTGDGIIFNGGAMTWVYFDKSKSKWFYILWWSPRVYSEGAISEGQQRTLIHELTHVWQGQHGTYPTDYWYGSMKNQTWEGLKDIIEKKAYEGWDTHRGRTYAFKMDWIGFNNWNDFNYEQQASLVETWYTADFTLNHFNERIPGGNMSTLDIRYPFITLNIRPGSPNAQFIPLQPLGKGADPIIKEIQNKLVELGYLEEIYADGYTGKHTTAAVRAFQANNSLKIDGDLGGPNSNTRRKLQFPTSQLVPAGARGAAQRAR